VNDLSLRARLIAGLTAVALVLTAVAWTITAITRNHLIDQTDDVLIASSDPDRDRRLADLGPPRPPNSEPRTAATSAAAEPGIPPERLSAMFEGVLLADGSLQVFFEPNLPGQENFSPPDLDPAEVMMADGPFTTTAVNDDVRYRVLAVTGDERAFIRALPLADLDATVNRLILYEAAGVAAVLAVLAAVAWWVVRLGIRPINAMTSVATDISDSDLSARVPEPAAPGTEAGRLARAINTMLGRIETAVVQQRHTEERLRRFVADASHELRTPVTTIQGYAELYRHGGLRDGNELDDAMRRTEKEAHRMSRLVEDLLMLARLDRQRDPENGMVELSDAIDDTVANARVTSPDHRFVTTVEPNLVVSGDHDHLRQVLINLIGNATVHTPPGSTVTVAAHQAGPDVIVEIADDGPGIPVDHLERVTERFYRADPSRSRDRGGSGLGLAIAHSIVELHGGELSIESAPGQGTTVRVTVPIDG
jgi:two-component system OmpR family sensor kinase